MFTGIITDIGRILDTEERGDLRVRIATGYDTTTIDLGASVACSGVCLTVIDKADGWFAVDVSGETLSRTAPAWHAGAPLNLERPLRVGDELGGHIVQGHVDGVGKVVAVDTIGDSIRLVIAVPAAIAPYLAEKGSVAIDGVSLTVNQVEDGDANGARFGVNIIPHTAEMTTLGRLAPGLSVNIEIDVLARYLQRMQAYADAR